jgi:hypothetical protein
MATDMMPIVAQLPSSQDVGLQVLNLVIPLLTLIALAGICAGAWTTVQKSRLDHALKQQMIERGMSADEVVAVLAGGRPGNGGMEAPCASEVVVESDGEWHTGLVLKRDGERYLVHFVGTDMSDNDWVTADRVRFPASKESHCGAPWDWTFPAGMFAAGNWCGNGEKPKAARVDQEI